MKTNTRCSDFDRCKVCYFVNEDYHKYLNQKFRNDKTFIQENLDCSHVEILDVKPSPKLTGFRTTAKLPVRQVRGRIKMGLFKRNSHELVELEKCALHHPLINKVIAELNALFVDSNVTGFDEKTKKGDLGYIFIRVSRSTQDISIVFVLAKSDSKVELKSLSRKLAEKFKIASITYGMNDFSSNSIFPSKLERILGSKKLKDSVNNYALTVSPSSFYQTNPWVSELIYQRLQQLVSQGQNHVAWDLYCGIGQTSLVLAHAGYRLFGIEENASAILNAKTNFNINNLESEYVELLDSSVAYGLRKVPEWAEFPKVIVANPPKKGLDQELFDRIKTWDLKKTSLQFIYVSCNLQSFVQDVKKLEEAGLFLRQVEAFDMFVHSNKLEWLAVFTT